MYAHTEAHMYTFLKSTCMHSVHIGMQLNVHYLVDAWGYVQSEVFIYLAACKPRYRSDGQSFIMIQAEVIFKTYCVPSFIMYWN